MAAAEGEALVSNKATIFEASKECEVLFEECLQLPDMFENTWVLNQSASFRLWVESIGAFARWSASADARLQGNENMKAAVMGLLDALQLNLRQTIKAYKDPALAQSILDQQAQHNANHLEKVLSSGELSDDDETEAEGGISPQPSGRDEDDNIDSNHSDASSTTGSQFRPDHEVENILIRLHQLLLTIRSSRRFDWRERASRFIYPGSEDFRKHMEWYINERFRREYPEVAEFICTRLLLANVKRRNQFEYAREHALRLAEDKTRSTSGRHVASTAPEGEKGDDIHMEVPSHKDESSPQPTAPSEVPSRSVPSTRATDYDDAVLERSEVGTTSISSGRTFKDGQVTWPPPPKPPHINPALPFFPCPYCRRPLPVEYSTGRDSRKWRQHVKNDIQPYVCLFEECSTPLNLYSRSADWANHMRNAHGEMRYTCFAPKHEQEYVCFRTPENYKTHLVQDHAKTYDESEFQDLLARSMRRIPLDPVFYQCPICPGPEKHSVLDKRKQTQSVFSLPYSPSKRTKVDETLTSQMSAVIIPNKTAIDEDVEDGEDENGDGGHGDGHSEEAHLLRHIMAHLQYIALMTLPWAEDQGSARSSSVSVGQSLGHSNDNVVPEDHEGPVDVEAEEHPDDPTYYGESAATSEWSFITGYNAPQDIWQPNIQGFHRGDYSIAWICSRSLDLRVATAALDTRHDNFARHRSDPKSYVLGTVGRWNVVLAHHDLETSRGPLIVDLCSGFPNIGLFLSTGVSAASPWRDTSLGDVIVATLSPELSQKPFEFLDRDFLDNGPSMIRVLPAVHSLEQVDLRSALSSFEQEESTLASFAIYPGRERDIVFRAGYMHVGNHLNCDFCDPNQQILLPKLQEHSPKIHVGEIRFATRSMIDISAESSVSRSWTSFVAIDGSAHDLYTTREAQPLLVVRGVSDYADSHKPEFWKNHASTVAGAYAKALLLESINIEKDTPASKMATLKLGSGRP
ncbi:uncharacterized protein PV07_07459 [Cladophialophora immunda]|uniref:C2H2-type domain-containing protein n=1 Tax=Cladophialophora immunda TaxID=569365 RepID=A0A0D1ZIG0_9EURO|nr:uncharacterized protein PV07_07459 [Cladophialophora immunda]KIW27751.1 hypothetical protein PV07_07459 [Cladophialophora immunda]